ncbi:MAG: transposase, partial [Phycisphaerae bacterium]
MRTIPQVAEPLIREFEKAFTRPVYPRFIVLLFAAILVTGRRTVSNLLRTVQALAPGHPSSRVLSKRRWSTWRLARALAEFILNQWVPGNTVETCGDDSVDEHRGKKVYGKACHRDAVRSTHSYTAFRWGHKWVVLAILVKFPF